MDINDCTSYLKNEYMISDGICLSPLRLSILFWGWRVLVFCVWFMCNLGHVCSTSKHINDIANTIYHKLLFTHCSQGNENDSFCRNCIQTLKNQAHHKKKAFHQYDVKQNYRIHSFPTLSVNDLLNLLNCKSRMSILKF